MVGTSADDSPERLKNIWNQILVPVVLRRDGKGEKLRVRLPAMWPNEAPYGRHYYLWIQNGRRSAPRWNPQERCWELPKAWFNDLVNRCLREHKAIYVIQPYREKEICAAKCRDAKGHECQCSCMGANHGQGKNGSWFDVTDTFSVRWGERHLASRLMTAKP